MMNLRRCQRGYTLFSLVIVLVWLVGIIGWIANVVRIVHALNLPITGLFVLRCVGVVVAPLGAVLGYL